MPTMDYKTLRREIEDIDTLPTLPSILNKLLKVIENPRVSLKEIGNFISNDPVLTTRILRAVNSPIYGFPGRIATINQSLVLLGLNVVRGLLLGVSVAGIGRSLYNYLEILVIKHGTPYTSRRCLSTVSSLGSAGKGEGRRGLGNLVHGVQPDGGRPKI